MIRRGMMRPLLFATNYYVVADLQIQWIARMMYFHALSLAEAVRHK